MFMLNSAELEVCPANKCQIYINFIYFLLIIAEQENVSANNNENANNENFRSAELRKHAYSNI